MIRQTIPPALLERLEQVDTPAVCNPIEVVQGQRGFDRFTKGTMLHCRPGMPAMVGRAHGQDCGACAADRSGRGNQAMAARIFRRDGPVGPGPTVAVVKDNDDPDFEARRI